MLIDHLFVRFSVPRFLYGTWTQEPCFSRLKWLCWFILLAQGGSLRRSRAQFGWNIPNRFEHFLRMTSADTESPVAEVSTAQILRLGGSLEDCRRVLANSAFVIDTTERAWESQAEFWETTVCWIIAHGNSLSDDQCEQVLAWAMHEHTEAERHRVPPFLLKGKGLRAVLERSLAYRRQLARPWSGYRWRQRGWGWQPVDPPLEGWSFVELTSGEELFCEGQALHHCVATYAGQCAAGNAVIVSVRFMGERRLTIEIQPSTGLVIQAKGKRNRPASGDEQRVIRRWLERVVVPSLVNSPR
ncbi:MAG: PcfJ domain-containing protein [Gemmataceae bacterium]